MNQQKSQSTKISNSKNISVIAGLDVGSSKVCLVIAKPVNKTFQIIGLSSIPSSGVKKGAVVNIDATVEAIQKAREEAELMAGVRITDVIVGISGSHIESFNSSGMVAIKNHEVSQNDIFRVIEAAKAVAIKEDRELLHVLPQSFTVDSQAGIRDPVGMSGVRLEVGAHLVTGHGMNLLNLKKCVEKAGLKISGRALDPWAAAEAVLSQDEKDLGVAVVDMGASQSDIVMYINGSVRHTAVVPVGGAHLTQDISIGLRTPAAQAEEIKKKYGSAMTSLVSASELIDVPSVGGRAARTISRVTLAEVIEPRAEETLYLIQNEIIKSGYRELLGAGLVLTGGASCLEGLAELGEFIFEMPVRRGYALNTSGLKEVVNSPIFATAVGLVNYGAEHGVKVEKTFFDRIKDDLSSLF